MNWISFNEKLFYNFKSGRAGLAQQDIETIEGVKDDDVKTIITCFRHTWIGKTKMVESEWKNDNNSFFLNVFVRQGFGEEEQNYISHIFH